MAIGKDLDTRDHLIGKNWQLLTLIEINQDLLGILGITLNSCLREKEEFELSKKTLNYQTDQDHLTQEGVGLQRAVEEGQELSTIKMGEWVYQMHLMA
jgi:hypothetical protein